MTCHATSISSLVEIAPVVGDRDAVLAVGEDVARARELLRAEPVDVRCVRDLDHLVALHDVATDAGDAGVGLVVDPDVAPVVGAVGERHVGMVGITVEIRHAPGLEECLGLREHLLTQDLEALVGLAPAGRAAAIEHGDAHQLAHGRHADDAHLPGLAAAPEAVVLVQIARAHVGFVGGGGGARRERRAGADAS
jgi:hypothetical protein